jgi:hypothetical protein
MKSVVPGTWNTPMLIGDAGLGAHSEVLMPGPGACGYHVTSTQETLSVVKTSVVSARAPPAAAASARVIHAEALRETRHPHGLESGRIMVCPQGRRSPLDEAF